MITNNFKNGKICRFFNGLFVKLDKLNTKGSSFTSFFWNHEKFTAREKKFYCRVASSWIMAKGRFFRNDQHSSSNGTSDNAVSEEKSWGDPWRKSNPLIDGGI